MIRSHPNQKPAIDKPKKPSPDFPLYAHRNGCWAKKIRGKTHFFGPWHNPDGALANYRQRKDDLHAGRKPRPERDRVPVKELANGFLNAKKGRVDNGELSPRTWDDYKRVCDLLVDRFGKNRLVADLRPDDFQELRKHMAATWGPHRLGTSIQMIRTVLKYACDSELIGGPVRFGSEFKRPSKKTMRLHRAQQGPRLFSREEIRGLLAAANLPMKGMILLGINAGFGNADCGQLPLSAANLETGWIDFPRPKTGIPRRAPLWPETVAALREYLSKRPAPKSDEAAPLFFVTKYGEPWFKETMDNPISKETTKLLRAGGINGRKGLGFYTLRHVFRTVADESKDQPAVDHIMGHESPHMSSVYRERISEERLLAVVNHVRAWLFGE
jgi:integrase